MTLGEEALNGQELARSQKERDLNYSTNLLARS